MKKSITRRKFLTFISFNLLALFLFLLLYSNIQVFAQPIVPPGLEIAKSVLDANTPILMANSEVVGTALGLGDDGNPVIQVFTKSERFSGIPSNIEGFPVEVVITGGIFALAPNCDKDGDGYNRNSKNCDVTGGIDCNDNDENINPGVKPPNLGPPLEL